jgi:subtilisin family serine protease
VGGLPERHEARHIVRAARRSRTISGLKRGLFILAATLALALAPAAQASNRTVEVVVTLKAPPLAQAFIRARTLAYSSFIRPNRLLLTAPASRDYLARLATTQRLVAARIRAAIPLARTRWHYGVVLDGFSVVVPQNRLDSLTRVSGVERVWPSYTYHELLDRTPQLIGAPTVWGPTLATAGEGMKIGIIDDGIDQTHPFFSAARYSYPPGFPKGQTAYTTPKVIVARTFAPPGLDGRYTRLPFDPVASDHATHVAGIAAGDDGTVTRTGFNLSGIAPRAYLGNYRALTVPSQFGLNGNSPELAAAVESAVRDGMDVINLSLGETDIEPTRDILARALNAAAAAGVVSTVAAGNSGDLGLGAIDSPASASKAIAAASSTGGHGSVETDTASDFSSEGPAPYSLTFKPDVTAPGDEVASAMPGGTYATLSGTSMSAPHVAGAVALLEQRHPSWTPAQIKSALMTTGAPVTEQGPASPLKQGGGRIDLPLADRPLLFTQPTALSFGLLKPGAKVTRTVTLTDAGGGAGTWRAAVTPASPGLVTVPAQVTVPGRLRVRVTVGRAASADITGFIVLARGTDSRHVPFWFRVERPRLQTERRPLLPRPGTYNGNTSRGVARVTTYRYPEVPPGDLPLPVVLPGREVAYTVHLRKRYANFGVAVISHAPGVKVEPRIVRGADENRLAGITALPLDANPYRPAEGSHRLISGVIQPAPGVYTIVFDTPARGRTGAFTFRFWEGDTTPPAVRVLGVRGSSLELRVSDGGSGVDPKSLVARVDDKERTLSYANGLVRISLRGLPRGRHTVSFTAADYQEAKNNENVRGILPNTRKLQRTFIVR